MNFFTIVLLQKGSLVVRETDGCDFELTWRNIALICHTTTQPAVKLGKGDFIAEVHSNILKIYLKGL